MLTRLVLMVLSLLVVSGAALSSGRAQPTGEADRLDVSGEWVGIIEWANGGSIPGEWSDILVYRLNVRQNGTTLKATHLTEGEEDALYTQPVDRYAELPDFGFEGVLEGTTLTFEGVPIFMGRCSINLTLHYGMIEGDHVLSGTWQPTPIILPTPRPITPDPSAPPVPDMVVGCGYPDGERILLRWVGPSPVADEG
jgi:hypothetical protein